MHPFAAFVVRNEKRWVLGEVRVNQRLDPVRNRIKRMENVEEQGAGGEGKVHPQWLDTSHRHEHPWGVNKQLME